MTARPSVRSSACVRCGADVIPGLRCGRCVRACEAELALREALDVVARRVFVWLEAEAWSRANPHESRASIAIVLQTYRRARAGESAPKGSPKRQPSSRGFDACGADRRTP
jgi:ferredoxin